MCDLSTRGVMCRVYVVRAWHCACMVFTARARARSAQRVGLGAGPFRRLPLPRLRHRRAAARACVEGPSQTALCPPALHTDNVPAHRPASSPSGFRCPRRRTRGSDRAWPASPGGAWSSWLCPFLNPAISGLPPPAGLLSPGDLLGSGNLATGERKRNEARRQHYQTRSEGARGGATHLSIPSSSSGRGISGRERSVPRTLNYLGDSGKTLFSV